MRSYRAPRSRISRVAENTPGLLLNKRWYLVRHLDISDRACVCLSVCPGGVIVIIFLLFLYIEANGHNSHLYIYPPVPIFLLFTSDLLAFCVRLLHDHCTEHLFGLLSVLYMFNKYMCCMLIKYFHVIHCPPNMHFYTLSTHITQHAPPTIHPTLRKCHHTTQRGHHDTIDTIDIRTTAVRHCHPPTSVHAQS